MLSLPSWKILYPGSLRLLRWREGLIKWKFLNFSCSSHPCWQQKQQTKPLLCFPYQQHSALKVWKRPLTPQRRDFKLSSLSPLSPQQDKTSQKGGTSLITSRERFNVCLRAWNQIQIFYSPEDFAVPETIGWCGIDLCFWNCPSSHKTFKERPASQLSHRTVLM